MLMDSFAQTKIHTRHRLGHSLIVLGLMSFLVFSVLISTVSSQSAVAFGTSTIFDLTNQARRQNGLKDLVLNDNLTNAAQEKADDMAERGYFEHTAPDGTTGWDFIEKTNYDYSFAGENLAASNEDDIAVVDGWLNSPGHRANLLSNKFKDIGLGMAYIDNYDSYQNVYFIVALYGLESSASTVTLGQTTTPPLDGLSSFSSSSFTINSSLSFIIISLSLVLLIAGVGLELRRLQKHFVSIRHAH